jgi:hypothetical protein
VPRVMWTRYHPARRVLAWEDGNVWQRLLVHPRQLVVAPPRLTRSGRSRTSPRTSPRSS